MAASTTDPGKLVESLRELLGPLADAARRQLEDALAQRVSAAATSIHPAQAFETWKRQVSSSVLVGAADDVLRAEFSRQTAYVYLVRLLLARICEDKRLLQWKPAAAGRALSEERLGHYLDFASGRSYTYLTRMASEHAQVHFHGTAQPFDWYRMDGEMLLAALLALGRFNLERIDTDILGAVYGRERTGGKHEQGRYYTPRPLVQTEWYLCALAASAPIQRWMEANKRSMKDDVYPEDIKAIPIKDLPPAKQAPFIELEQERHRLWRELISLEESGYVLKEPFLVPARRLAERFRHEHPEIKHVTLLQAAAKGLFHVEEAFLVRDMRGARASSDAIKVGKEVAVRVGGEVHQKARVARVLARYLAELPGTFADRQHRDMLPGDEAGLLFLGAYLDAEAASVRERMERIKAIGARIDEAAWALYRPVEPVV